MMRCSHCGNRACSRWVGLPCVRCDTGIYIRPLVQGHNHINPHIPAGTYRRAWADYANYHQMVNNYAAIRPSTTPIMTSGNW